MGTAQSGPPLVSADPFSSYRWDRLQDPGPVPSALLAPYGAVAAVNHYGRQRRDDQRETSPREPTFGGADASPTQLMTRAEVERLVGLTCSSIYRAMRAGTFPEPLRINAGVVRWRANEIQAWIDGRPRASGTVGAAA